MFHEQLLMNQRRWDVATYRELIGQITPDDVMQTLRGVLARVCIEGMAVGNVEASGACGGFVPGVKIPVC
jgi:hypothetical protein